MVVHTITITDIRKMNLVYIENDTFLSDEDKEDIELALSQMGETTRLEEWTNMEFIFDALSNTEQVFSAFLSNKDILLNTRFSGNSMFMLKNMIHFCKQKGVKDKVILNCVSNRLLRSILEDFEDDLLELEEKNNIRFYGLPTDKLSCFEKTFSNQPLSI